MQGRAAEGLLKRDPLVGYSKADRETVERNQAVRWHHYLERLRKRPTVTWIEMKMAASQILAFSTGKQLLILTDHVKGPEFMADYAELCELPDDFTVRTLLDKIRGGEADFSGHHVIALSIGTRDAQEEPSRLKKWYQDLVRLLRSRYNCEVMITSLLPLQKEAAHRALAVQLNVQLQEVCQEEGAHYVDTLSRLQVNGEIDSAFSHQGYLTPPAVKSEVIAIGQRLASIPKIFV